MRIFFWNNLSGLLTFWFAFCVLLTKGKKKLPLCIFAYYASDVLIIFFYFFFC